MTIVHQSPIRVDRDEFCCVIAAARVGLSTDADVRQELNEITLFRL